MRNVQEHVADVTQHGMSTSHTERQYLNFKHARMKNQVVAKVLSGVPKKIARRHACEFFTRFSQTHRAQAYQQTCCRHVYSYGEGYVMQF